MTTIASDTFTDSDGTLLQNHTPSGGGSWTKFIGGAGVDIEIYSNKATASGNNACYYHSVDPTTAEYDCTYTLKSSGDTNYAVGLTSRSSTSAETFYLYHATVGFHYLYKAVAGGYTELGNYAVTPAVDDVIKLETKDASKKIFVNGTERINSNNNDLTAKGKFGLRCYGTSTTFGHDDWQVDEAQTYVGAAAGTSTATAVAGAIGASSGTSTASALAGSTAQSAGTSTAAAIYGQVQIMRPIADIAANGWLPSTGGDLYAMLDETTADDADYIYSPTDPTTQQFEVKLSSADDPLVSDGHVITLRLQAAPGNNTNFDLDLVQGSTVLDSWTENVLAADGLVERSRTLSGAVADSITNYADLRVRGIARA